jgi:hypothetical protein
MHLKKLLKKKKFLYYTGVLTNIFILEYLFLDAFCHFVKLKASRPRPPMAEKVVGELYNNTGKRPVRKN